MGLVHTMVSACPLGVECNLQRYLSWEHQRDVAVDSDYDRVACGAHPSLQKVLPKIAAVEEFGPTCY